MLRTAGIQGCISKGAKNYDDAKQACIDLGYERLLELKTNKTYAEFVDAFKGNINHTRQSLHMLVNCQQQS